MKIIKFFSFSVFFIFFFGINIQVIEAADLELVPPWIKKNAGWWADNEITDNDFIQSIQWLIENEIIIITSVQRSMEESQGKIPTWIREVAHFWADDKISDKEFLNGIKFLVDIGIIQVPTNIVDLSENSNIDKEKFLRESDPRYELLGNSPFFKMFAFEKDFIMTPSGPVALERHYEFKPDVPRETYQKIVIDLIEQRALVVIPTFTSSAYAEPNGFYAYFRGECDSCTTTKIDEEKSLGYTASGNAVAVMKLLGYQFITDITLAKNPEILKQYDKIIMLHNEYVTKEMFYAVTNHPKVLYLFPNALYGKIEINYEDKTITLIRGHGYPPQDPVKNGFDWEYEDLNHPWEYDTECKNWKFVDIKNGTMLNCYPEIIIHKDKKLLSMIKEY